MSGELAYFTLFGQIILLVLFLSFVMVRVVKLKSKMARSFLVFFEQNGLPLAFLTAFSATVGSLFLSEVARFPPCKLCWYQRIFMYPQAVILGIALMVNDFSVRKYILALSSIGFLIAVYHYFLQLYPSILPCSDEIANCALKQFIYFGYITIPIMSATSFALTFLFVFLHKNSHK